jgi:acyl carrier protein
MTAKRKGETEERLRAFIVAELAEGPYTGDDPLAAGVVSSLGVAQLLDYIEETFGVELEDEEIIEENFESVSLLAKLVDSKC